jgi:hypothetical protein
MARRAPNLAGALKPMRRTTSKPDATPRIALVRKAIRWIAPLDDPKS